MFDTVLVANRGEIAVRIIRACRELDLVSVAVYSDVDRLSPHVLEADKAVRIGPAPSSESYLRGEYLIEVAGSAGAGAIHPGYGFLAERASFAAAVEKAGLVFIGPSPESIQAMGDKTEARRRMAEAGVPIIPGALEPASGPEKAADTAHELGFPILLKAVAGGGGKGMRVVSDAAELPGAFEAVSREAEAAFGDGAIYVEKYLARPRHIEIQVLGDQSGAVVHLGERECSIQRRHQKLIEESPAPLLEAGDREAMGLAAVQAARAVEYRECRHRRVPLPGRRILLPGDEHPVTGRAPGHGVCNRPGSGAVADPYCARRALGLLPGRRRVFGARHRMSHHE